MVLIFADIMEIQARKIVMMGSRSSRIALLCSLLVLNAAADYIVDLGSASDFLFLDIGTDPSHGALLGKGAFTGDIGWSGSKGTTITMRGSLDGNLYRAPGSSLKDSRGLLLGTDNSDYDMSSFIADVDAAVARFGMLAQDIDLGNVDQSGALTLNRTDKYTVVDMSTFRMSSGTLTLNGQADDIFYIRVRDIFELSNVDIVINGTDSSRVFFIYDGTSDLSYDGGSILGNIIAPNAAVTLSKIDGFSGSVISGDGFTVSGSTKKMIFNTEAVPESTALALIAMAGGSAIFLHRIFKWRNINSDA
jgi:hypothetical protein